MEALAGELLLLQALKLHSPRRAEVDKLIQAHLAESFLGESYVAQSSC